MTIIQDTLFIGGEWVPPSSASRIEVRNGGSVWTADPARARHVVRQVRTGTMGINGYLPDPAGPWGGVKSSGLGRELGPGAITAYQNLKTVYA
jgi:acyl-CoA reductase-like NAD-dependent aldehyde dehydrogenase